MLVGKTIYKIFKYIMTAELSLANVKDGNYGKLVGLYNFETNEVVERFKLDKYILCNPNYVLFFKIPPERKEEFKYNDLNIKIDDFPWKSYYKLNLEIVNGVANCTKANAWKHWEQFGKREERAFSYINNSNDHRARFGNIFFLNMCLHLFSLKFDLQCNYKYEKQFSNLGIQFNKGNKTYNKNVLLTDYNFEKVLECNMKPKNIIINNNVWFHTHNFCKTINDHFLINNLFEKVKMTNIYNKRFNSNNDLFVHVRLGDVTDRTVNIYKYYEHTIKAIKFDKGFITSDNINHSICKSLINKFGLKIIDKDEIQTIMFGNTCKHIVLSGGTFSWLIAFLSHKSNVYYPELDDANKWYGDIFRFSNWNKVIVKDLPDVSF